VPLGHPNVLEYPSHDQILQVEEDGHAVYQRIPRHQDELAVVQLQDCGNECWEVHIRTGAGRVLDE
jgi:hypothetical protein